MNHSCWHFGHAPSAVAPFLFFHYMFFKLLGETVFGLCRNGYHKLLAEFLTLLRVCNMHMLLNGGRACLPCLLLPV